MDPEVGDKFGELRAVTNDPRKVSTYLGRDYFHRSGVYTEHYIFVYGKVVAFFGPPISMNTVANTSS
jgi:hypothetical protein